MNKKKQHYTKVSILSVYAINRAVHARNICSLAKNLDRATFYCGTVKRTKGEALY